MNTQANNTLHHSVADNKPDNTQEFTLSDNKEMIDNNIIVQKGLKFLDKYEDALRRLA